MSKTWCRVLNSGPLRVEWHMADLNAEPEVATHGQLNFGCSVPCSMSKRRWRNEHFNRPWTLVDHLASVSCHPTRPEQPDVHGARYLRLNSDLRGDCSEEVGRSGMLTLLPVHTLKMLNTLYSVSMYRLRGPQFSPLYGSPARGHLAVIPSQFPVCALDVKPADLGRVAQAGHVLLRG